MKMLNIRNEIQVVDPFYCIDADLGNNSCVQRVASTIFNRLIQTNGPFSTFLSMDDFFFEIISNIDFEAYGEK